MPRAHAAGSRGDPGTTSTTSVKKGNAVDPDATMALNSAAEDDGEDVEMQDGVNPAKGGTFKVFPLHFFHVLTLQNQGPAEELVRALMGH